MELVLFVAADVDHVEQLVVAGVMAGPGGDLVDHAAGVRDLARVGDVRSVERRHKNLWRTGAVEAVGE